MHDPFELIPRTSSRRLLSNTILAQQKEMPRLSISEDQIKDLTILLIPSQID